MLFKCGLDGRRKWVTFTSGSKSGGTDVWTDLAVDNRGRIHVTGFCTRNDSREDIVTRLYSSSGTRLWQHIYPSEPDAADVGTALAIDSSRHTYVCGWRTSGGDEEALVIKYGTGGDVLWESVYPDPGNYPGETDAGDDWANDVTVFGENVYVAGAHDVDHGGSVDADFLSLAIWR